MSRFRIPIPVRIGALLFAGVLVILAGGYLAYTSLTSMVRLLQEGTTPEYGLVTIKEISNSLERAEDNIRLYGMTREDLYLDRYTEALGDLDSSVSRLSRQYRGDPWFLSKTDSIKARVGQMVQLWDEMIMIREIDGRRDRIEGLIAEMGESGQEAENNKGIFKRIFGPNRKDVARRRQKILESLTALKNDEKETENRLLEKEKELARTGESLSDALMSMMARLEKHEKQAALEQVNNGEKLASRTYKLLGIFSLTGTLLSIGVLVLIIQFIRKNKKYNQVLVRSRAEAENLARSKELFMANVSHEIRTPLNAISGFIKQLRSSPVDPSVSNKLRIVESASDQLIRLINDVLDFTKLQAGKLLLKNVHFDAEDLFGNVCDLFSELAARNGNALRLEVRNEGNLIIFGDTHRLQQILYNLLSNAVKFTRNGRIDVRLDLHPSGSGRVDLQFTVKDTGLGMDSSKLDEMFEEYTQEDQNMAVEYGGTGLGLSIVKKLVELFEGEISVESEKGVGTKVTCRLSFEQGDPEKTLAEAEDRKEPALPAGLRILVADDEEYNRYLVGDILDRWKADYDLAKNGLEAIELVKNGNFDAILMDLRMPVIDGLTATRFIRETLKLPREKLPVIGITADISRSLPPEVAGLFNAIIVKPFTETELYHAMRPEGSAGDGATGQGAKPAKEHGRDADLSNLLRTAGNDLKFIESMIGKFEESTREGLKEMRDALGKDQYSQVSELAHKLAPASRHLGVHALLNLLKQIEEEAGVKNAQALQDLISEAEESAFAAFESLNRQLQEIEQ